ncbi:hypothetical protein [Streptomyces sp. NPDC055055]
MFAAVCVLLAATGHVLMSGRDLPSAVLAPASVGTLVVAWLLAGRERGLLAVTAATVAVQSALHAAFSWSQQHDAAFTAQPVAELASTSRAGTDHAAMSHAAMGHVGHMGGVTAMAHRGVTHEAVGHADLSHTALDATAQAHMAMGHMPSGSQALAHQAASSDMTNMSSSLGMLSAHLLAALLSGLWMAYGERAVFRLVRSLPLWHFRPPWSLGALLTAAVPVRPPHPRIRRTRAADERPPGPLLLAHSVITRGPPRVFAVS